VGRYIGRSPGQSCCRHDISFCDTTYRNASCNIFSLWKRFVDFSEMLQRKNCIGLTVIQKQVLKNH